MLCKAALFGDAESYRRIAASAEPRKTKALGRKV